MSPSGGVVAQLVERPHCAQVASSSLVDPARLSERSSAEEQWLATPQVMGSNPFVRFHPQPNGLGVFFCVLLDHLLPIKKWYYVFSSLHTATI